MLDMTAVSSTNNNKIEYDTHTLNNSPLTLYKPYDMPESMHNVTKSPRLAAIGVATLSGLICSGRDNRTIMIIKELNIALAKHAADILEPPTKRMCVTYKCCPPIALSIIEVSVAINATTNACPWIKDRLPHVSNQRSLQVSMFPRFAYKEIHFNI